jgi:hypothetical protein
VEVDEVHRAGEARDPVGDSELGVGSPLLELRDDGRVVCHLRIERADP